MRPHRPGAPKGHSLPQGTTHPYAFARVAAPPTGNTSVGGERDIASASRSRAGEDELATEPRRDDKLPSEEIYDSHAAFDGELGDVTGARTAAEGFLGILARTSPPAAVEHWDDVLLVVTELAANAVQYAPGRFELTMRRTLDGVHVTLGDSSTTSPTPRPFSPSKGAGGIGWYLIHTLCDEVSVVTHDHGKDVHVFLPW